MAFWLVMMGSLVRLEFFPKPSTLQDVPAEHVLQDIFANDRPARLKVYYGETEIGFLNVDVAPMYAERNRHGTEAEQKPVGYHVNSELRLNLDAIKDLSRLRLISDSIFNNRYELERFDIRTTVANNYVNVQGDSHTRQVSVQYAIGGNRGERQFDFEHMQGAGLASALGLPGLASIEFLGGTSNEDFTKQVTTTTHLGRLVIGGEAVETYVFESRYGESLWVKIWVNKAGEILKVDTSMGLAMRSISLDADAAASAEEVIGTDRGNRETTR